MSQSNPDRDPNSVLRYAGLSTQWLVMLGLAIFGGIKLDGWLKWRFPLFTVTLPLLALVLSLWQLIRSVNKKE